MKYILSGALNLNIIGINSQGCLIEVSTDEPQIFKFTIRAHNEYINKVSKPIIFKIIPDYRDFTVAQKTSEPTNAEKIYAKKKGASYKEVENQWIIDVEINTNMSQ